MFPILTIKQHCQTHFQVVRLLYVSKYLRTDIVFDVYRFYSLKAVARLKRDFGAICRILTTSGNIPSKWQSFLRDRVRTGLN